MCGSPPRRSSRRRRQPRFAVAGLAGKQNHLALAVLRLGPAPQRAADFFLSSDQGGEAGRVRGVEAAFRRTRPQRRLGPRLTGDPLQVLRPEDCEARTGCRAAYACLQRDRHVGFGDRLKTRREIRRHSETEMKRLTIRARLIDSLHRDAVSVKRLVGSSRRMRTSATLAKLAPRLDAVVP